MFPPILRLLDDPRKLQNAASIVLKAADGWQSVAAWPETPSRAGALDLLCSAGLGEVEYSTLLRRKIPGRNVISNNITFQISGYVDGQWVRTPQDNLEPHLRHLGLAEGTLGWIWELLSEKLIAAGDIPSNWIRNKRIRDQLLKGRVITHRVRLTGLGVALQTVIAKMRSSTTRLKRLEAVIRNSDPILTSLRVIDVQQSSLDPDGATVRLGETNQDRDPREVLTTMGERLPRNEFTPEDRSSSEWGKILGLTDQTFRNRMRSDRKGPTWHIVEVSPQRYIVHIDALPPGLKSQPLRDDALTKMS